MKTTVSFDFKIGESVIVYPFDNMKGTVIAYFVDCNGRIQYQVRYFANNDVKTDYFFKEELQERKKPFLSLDEKLLENDDATG